MKKHLFILFIVFSYGICKAQWLDMFPIEYLNYAYEGYSYKRMLIQDSILYTTRHGGLEEVNMNDYSMNSFWSNYYPIDGIVADTGNTYVYLVDNDSIMRFNSLTQTYENIWPDSLQNKNLADIDVAENGDILAVFQGNNKGVAIYNGLSWSIHPFEPYIYGGFQGINVINDTLAYIYAGASRFFAFHNGLFDTISIDIDKYVKDWDVDPEGNLWAARGTDLLHMYEGITTIYDTANTPIGTDEFLNIEIASNGHIWLIGNSNKIFEFNGTSWQVHNIPVNFPGIENFTLDQQDQPWVIIHKFDGRFLYNYDGNNWTSSPIPFMPIKNAKAMGLKTSYSNYGYFATDEGFFIVNMSNFYIHTFKSVSDYPHADDINCFTDNDPTNYYPTFGTSYGIVGLQGFNNALLPSLNINYISYDNGTYYIATDSGLVAYNGILYSYINTSNSPIPSDKITFVTTGNNVYCGENGGLYIGTDKGIAIYNNAQWSVFDSINIPVNNFNVSGVLPPCFDDGTYISTLGNGLIKVYPNGDYELFNTSMGNLLDDTLYYVRYMFLAECGDYIVTGTHQNGIAYSQIWGTEYFDYETQYNNTPLINSKMAVNGNYFEMNMIATDAMYFILTPCGAVVEKPTTKQLAWFQQGNTLNITIPEDLYGKGEISLLDILGKTVIVKQDNIQTQQYDLDIGGLTTGVYIFKIISGNKMGYSKVIISR